ncbi:MAG TPA: DMT family transporter [Usitatibacter sp.]|nr:DMT family transporter [Usitatibacter sp.]
MNTRMSWRTAALLTLPPLLWAGNAVLGAIVVASIPPLALNALRWSLAFVFLLPLGFRAFSRPREIALRWRYLALVGLLGIGCYNAFQYLALTSSTPLNVTLIAASSSLWMLLVGMVGFRTLPTWRQAAGATLSIVGVLLVLSRGSAATLLGLRFVAGDLYMVLATLAWAIYSWMLVRPPASMRGDARPRWNWAEMLIVQVAFGALWAAAGAAAEQALHPHAIAWTPALLGALAYVALGPAVLAYYAWGEGVARVGPTVAALFSNLTPLFTALLSLAVLGATPRWYHAAAFALIAVGIVISSARRAPVR